MWSFSFLWAFLVAQMVNHLYYALCIQFCFCSVLFPIVWGYVQEGHLARCQVYKEVDCTPHRGHAVGHWNSSAIVVSQISATVSCCSPITWPYVPSNEYLLTISRLFLFSDFRWHISFLHLILHQHWNHAVLMTVDVTQMSLFILTLMDIQSFVRNAVLGLLAMSLDLFCVAIWRVSETMTLLLLSSQNLLHLLLNYNSITVCCCCSVTKSCWTLCDTHGLQPTRLLTVCVFPL